MKRKLKIKCINLDNYKEYKFHILIYDSFHKVYDDFKYCTDYLYFNSSDTNFKLVIIAPYNLYPSVIKTSFIINDCTLVFNFRTLYNITFIIKDSNYENLGIQKGMILLWQDHIQ